MANYMRANCPFFYYKLTVCKNPLLGYVHIQDVIQPKNQFKTIMENGTASISVRMHVDVPELGRKMNIHFLVKLDFVTTHRFRDMTEACVFQIEVSNGNVNLIAYDEVTLEAKYSIPVKYREE